MQPQDPNSNLNNNPVPGQIPQPPENTGPKVNNPLAAMRQGEQILCEIKRHPIGIINMYIGIGMLLVLAAIVGYVVAPALFTDYSKAQVYGWVSIAMLVAVAFSLIFLVVGHIVYWGNRWIVTDDSVTQIIQNSLFSKQSSQLSMGNLEDITVEQNGILPHMFNYGILKAETAGERSKFRLMYCPNPNHYAQQILQAREAFEQDNYRTPESQRQAYPSNANQQSS